MSSTSLGMIDPLAFGGRDNGVGKRERAVPKSQHAYGAAESPAVFRGTGLSMAYGFARQSGCAVGIHSKPGHGKTVRLYFLL
ncbi:hypothetical protein [Caballeronia sp. RCC_10]|uniref:hypothetical protein n=1 Tax=Caballeronia sp. RCC_10 TaxID=3239227 RepID=UPI0035259002